MSNARDKKQESNLNIEGVIRLHALSINNKSLLDLEWQASCFGCFSKFHPDKIQRWTDKGQTAICPHCGVDSVLPGDFSSAVLDEMYDHWFEFEI